MTFEQVEDGLAETIARIVCWPSVLFGMSFENAPRNFSLIFITLPISLVLASPLIVLHIMLYFIIERYQGIIKLSAYVYSKLHKD